MALIHYRIHIKIDGAFRAANIAPTTDRRFAENWAEDFRVEMGLDRRDVKIVPIEEGFNRPFEALLNVLR